MGIDQLVSWFDFVPFSVQFVLLLLLLLFVLTSVLYILLKERTTKRYCEVGHKRRWGKSGRGWKRGKNMIKIHRIEEKI